MSILFTESLAERIQLLPLTYTRPIADLRIGILRISEKWLKHLGQDQFGFQTEEFLHTKYPRMASDEDTLWINGGLLPNKELVKSVNALKTGESLCHDGLVLVLKGKEFDKEKSKQLSFNKSYTRIQFPWDIFLNNGQEIRNDYALLTDKRISQKITDPYTRIYGEEVFLEKGVTIKAAVLNSETGPIYLGKNAEIHEGAVIRGPFALGDHSVVGMGCKVRGDTTVGPYSKIGGEVSNSMIFGFSNKAHDGYLGNAVIGEWCNLGAGTSNSNLKNNYSLIKMWNYGANEFTETGLQFCGLIMGDHSKAAINTTFNTGSSVGVSTNLFGEGFPRQIVPSFSWGGSRGFMTYAFEKSIETIQSAMGRRRMNLSNIDIEILRTIFEQTTQLRVWEKQNK